MYILRHSGQSTVPTSTDIEEVDNRAPFNCLPKQSTDMAMRTAVRALAPLRSITRLANGSTFRPVLKTAEFHTTRPSFLVVGEKSPHPHHSADPQTSTQYPHGKESQRPNRSSKGNRQQEGSHHVPHNNSLRTVANAVWG